MTIEGGVAPALTAEMLTQVARDHLTDRAIVWRSSSIPLAREICTDFGRLVAAEVGLVVDADHAGHHVVQGEAVLGAVQGAPLRFAHAFRVAYGP